MGELRAFVEVARMPTPQRDPRSRVVDYEEISGVASAQEAAREGARCMYCGVPFCHDGCPLGNLTGRYADTRHRAVARSPEAAALDLRPRRGW